MIDSSATELKGGNHSEAFDKDGGVEGLWQAAKRRDLASDLPELDAKKPSTVLQKPRRFLLLQRLSSVLSDLDVSPCCVLHYIPHSTFHPPPRETNSKGGIPGKWLRMLLAARGGEAHPTLLPAGCTRSLYFTKTADTERRREMVFIYCLHSITHARLKFFNPIWG